MSGYSFTEKLWVYEGAAAWYFLSLPQDIADSILASCLHRPRGFGAVKVEVSIGASVWTTSVFPDSKRQTYLLPVKSMIRKQENLSPGQEVTVTLRLL